MLLAVFTSYGQNINEHLVGIRAGYNISGLDTRPDLEYNTISTTQNYSFVYTYYHSLWGTINIFGFQTGINKSSQGYETPDGINRYEVISIPFVSQFHFDFWKMRILLNAGGFGGVRTSRENFDGSGFDEFDNKIDYGFIAGGGLAFVIRPVEIHLEGNYHYSLSYLHKPDKFSETDYLFTYPKQFILSVTLNVNF
jgi:opacity protein-like surface antigen